MKKKLIFLDMDGTLIDHAKNEIPASTKEAVKQLKEAGHVCAIATGRCPSLLYGFDKQLEIDHIIASNGRYVRVGNQILHHQTMPETRVKALTRVLEDHHIGMAFQTAEVYTAKALFGDAHILFAQHYNEEVPQVTEEFDHYDRVLQMIIYTKDPLPKVIMDEFADFTFTKSCAFGYDATMGEGMKEVGVKRLRDWLGFKFEDTIAIGDGMNDISMFEHVATSIAMGNALPKVQSAATMITQSVDQDGIFKAFETLGMIKRV